MDLLSFRKILRIWCGIFVTTLPRQSTLLRVLDKIYLNELLWKNVYFTPWYEQWTQYLNPPSFDGFSQYFFNIWCVLLDFYGFIKFSEQKILFPLILILMNEMLCLQCLNFVALQHYTCLVMFNALCIMTIAICMTVSTFITIRYYMTIVVRPVIVDAIITKLTIYRTSFVHHHCDLFFFTRFFHAQTIFLFFFLSFFLVFKFLNNFVVFVPLLFTWKFERYCYSRWSHDVCIFFSVSRHTHIFCVV